MPLDSEMDSDEPRRRHRHLILVESHARTIGAPDALAANSEESVQTLSSGTFVPRESMAYAASKRQTAGLSYWLPTIALVALWLAFAWGNFASWRATGRPLGLGFVALELTTVALFVVRRQALESSRTLLAWIVTGLACFAPLAMRPTYEPVAGFSSLYEALQFAGLALGLVSLFTLGRSFGLIAANRGVQTRGVYGIVRHPIYTAYIVTQAGYLLANPSLYNGGILLLAWIFQFVRIGQEEDILSRDRAYADYMERVRYRLVPFLY